MPNNSINDEKCNETKAINYAPSSDLPDISSAGGGSLECNPTSKKAEKP
jgi:hypothetical protein